MKATVQGRFGPPDVLYLPEVGLAACWSGCAPPRSTRPTGTSCQRTRWWLPVSGRAAGVRPAGQLTYRSATC